MYQKQNADGFVTSCAQRHEKGEFSDALELCANALDIYVELNSYTKLIPGFKDGLFWADIAQTTVCFRTCAYRARAELFSSLSCQDNIGVVNMNMGNNEVALQYHEQALRMRESKLGPEHADVAATKDNMGLVYRQLNHLDMALQLHQQALAIRLKTAAGPADLSVCATKTAMANVLYQQEDYAAALALYTDILQQQAYPETQAPILGLSSGRRTQ